MLQSLLGRAIWEKTRSLTPHGYSNGRIVNRMNKLNTILIIWTVAFVEELESITDHLGLDMWHRMIDNKSQGKSVYRLMDVLKVWVSIFLCEDFSFIVWFSTVKFLNQEEGQSCVMKWWHKKALISDHRSNELIIIKKTINTSIIIIWMNK